MRDFLKLAMTGKNDEIKLEVIGILANIKLEEKWFDYMNDFFIDFLSKSISNGIVEEDIIL